FQHGIQRDGAGLTHLISGFAAGCACSPRAGGGTDVPVATCFARECRFSGGFEGSAAGVLLPVAGWFSGATTGATAGCGSDAAALPLFAEDAPLPLFEECRSGTAGTFADGGSSRTGAAGATATLPARRLCRDCFSGGGEPARAASASCRDGGLG